MLLCYVFILLPFNRATFRLDAVCSVLFRETYAIGLALEIIKIPPSPDTLSSPSLEQC